MPQWEDLARQELPFVMRRYAPTLTEAEWFGYCRGVVDSARGRFVSRGAKVAALAQKIEDFLPCVPEHGSSFGDEDEQGHDYGGGRRHGCLLPPSHRFDRAAAKSLPAAAWSGSDAEEPEPYLEDLFRDWDLVAYLTLPAAQAARQAEDMVSAADPDWWAYAMLSANGFCPEEGAEEEAAAAVAPAATSAG